MLYSPGMRRSFPVLALFTGSFLLFGIQPMLGRTLLPTFGGSAAVWTVCLAAYQVLLLAGYGYAHVIARQGHRTQRRCHQVLLAVAVLWAFAFAALRLALRDRLGMSAFPALEVVLGVFVIVGIPYVLLSAGSTLIQAWLTQSDATPADPQTPPDSAARSEPLVPRGDANSADCLGAVAPDERGRHTPRRGVYRLYAVSNLGSLAGLLAYPFLVEPFLSLNVQWYGFATALVLYAGLIAIVARHTSATGTPSVAIRRAPPCRGSEAAPDHPSQASDPRSAAHDLRADAGTCRDAFPPSLSRPWLWFALPALSTFFLNAVTVHLSSDVTPIPMLWTLLLTAFLGSYVIGFSKVGEKGLIVWAGLAALALPSACVGAMRISRALLSNLALCTALILFCCTFLHSWLYRIRPDAASLTRFYLGIAAGGAAGGASAALLAPVVFDRVWEFPIALSTAALACLCFLQLWRRPGLRRWQTGGLQMVVASTLYLVSHMARQDGQDVLLRTRNFYGCLRVSLANKIGMDGLISTTQLHHNGTLHGLQAYGDGPQAKRPTTYYGIPGGGLALINHANYTNGTPMRVGLIGLGIGTMACYGRTNDLYRFYEINPQVVAIARDTRWFSYLADSRAAVETVLGDARKNLEAERARGEPRHDVLVIDAYSGDAVPYHLATREAFDLYRDRLAPGGILAVHISNWHLDLLPLCKAMAERLGLYAYGTHSPRTGLLSAAIWVFLSDHPLAINDSGVALVEWDNVRTITPPADEKGSLIGLLRH